MSNRTSPQENPRAAAIDSATGTPLATWVERIDEAGGRDLDHTAIARLLVAQWGVGEWWAQSLTVAYEQVVGRRVVGQSCDGDFSASASRTVAGDMDAVRGAWDAFMTTERREQLGLGEPRLTDTATWRYWRAPLTDGTRVSINVTAKDGAGESARSTLGVEHKGIETADARSAWKDVWKTTLADFTATAKEER